MTDKLNENLSEGGLDLRYPDGIKFENPNLPLEYYEGPCSNALAIPELEKEMLFKLASWEENPPFNDGGRSCFVPRKEIDTFDGHEVGGYKLKGIGNFDSKSKTASPPRIKNYESHFKVESNSSEKTFQERLAEVVPVILIHKGIADDGSFYPVLDPEKPLGGLSPDRAKNEIEIATSLMEADVPACRPVAWGMYPDLRWGKEKEALEFCILATPNQDPNRMGEYFEPDRSVNYYRISPLMDNAVNQTFDIHQESGRNKAALMIANKMAKSIGETLKKAHHEAGVARFAGHTGNYSYMPESKSVYMHDFDSSIKLENIDPRARSISMIRDLESAMIGFVLSLGHSNLYHLINNKDFFSKNSPLVSLAEGYFAEEVSPNVKAKMLEVLRLNLDTALRSRGGAPSIEKQQEWTMNMSMQLSDHLFNTCFSLYKNSSFNSTNTLPYGEKELVSSQSSFNGRRDQLYLKRQQELAPTLPAWARAYLGV